MVIQKNLKMLLDEWTEEVSQHFSAMPQLIQVQYRLLFNFLNLLLVIERILAKIYSGVFHPMVGIYD